MCAPGCIETLAARLSRRGLIGSAVALAGAAVAVPSPAAGRTRALPRHRRVIDLTHEMSPEFPTFFGVPGIALKKLKDFKADGFNMNEWTLLEHAGTHIDAPIHFSSEGAGPAELPVDQLVVPLAVIDVSAKAAENADYQLSPADISASERRYGRLPRGACVAMYSGWDRHVMSARYIGRDDKSVFHFPGIHPETAEMLIKERGAIGIAVDTLSLDHGPSKDFKTHYTWLPSGRWGLENVAGLGNVPARGSTLLVGAPKVKGATGGPVRLMALV